MRSSSATDRLTAVLLGLPARVGAGARALAPRSRPRPPRTTGHDVGTRGEQLVARIRLVLTSILLLLAFAPRPDPFERRMAVAFGLAAFSIGWLLHWLAARSDRPGLGYVSSGLDVTLVSAAYWATATIGSGSDWFALYTLAIACASLRHDWRLAVLTGLDNRGAFDERLRAEWNRAHRYQRPFSVVVLDADHFKLFNDTHGHSAGDAALRTVAVELKRSLRASDVVARYGGEEFALLLPETRGDAALAKAQEVCATVAATRILVGRAGTARLTVSAGVATWPGDGRELEDILETADERLYFAKAGGRNRVVGPPSGRGGRR